MSSTSTTFSVNQKGFAPILIVVLIAVLALSGGYLVYQKQPTPTYTPSQQTVKPSAPPDEISNWKTYTNTKYGYSISYPSNWYLFSTYPDNQLSPEVYDTVYITVADPKEFGLSIVGVPAGININIKKNPNRLSATKYVNQVVLPENRSYVMQLSPEAFVQARDINPDNVTVESANIPNVDAVLVKGLSNTAGFGNVGPEAYINSKDEIVNIIGSIHYEGKRGEKIPNGEKIFNQILSTFRFTQ